jgi:LDH2 family malate/lactate/ureidoglycolate dehydrogenase
VIAARAMELALRKAEATGSAWVMARGSNHFGAAAYFAQMALERDMVGIVSTNGPAAVAPSGGCRPMLSTNPLAFAIPAGEEPPVLLDMATTVVSRGRITLYARKGLEMPAHWALDERGSPTTDPKEALRGTLQPMAGYKGYGLSLVLDLLCGVLPGANYGMHFPGFLLDYDRPPSNVGSLFAALSIDAFCDVSEFKARVDQALREIKSSPRAPGVERIYAPGEIEYETRGRRLADGVPLPPDLIPELRALGEELGLAFPTPIEG